MDAGLDGEMIMSKWTSRVCAVTLTAVAMMTVAPASAMPISENTIRKECGLANGVYTTSVLYNRTTKKNDRFSACTYQDSRGDVYTDLYTNGEYTGTQ